MAISERFIFRKVQKIFWKNSSRGRKGEVKQKNISAFQNFKANAVYPTVKPHSHRLLIGLIGL